MLHSDPNLEEDQPKKKRDWDESDDSEWPPVREAKDDGPKHYIPAYEP